MLSLARPPAAVYASGRANSTNKPGRAAARGPAGGYAQERVSRSSCWAYIFSPAKCAGLANPVLRSRRGRPVPHSHRAGQAYCCSAGRIEGHEQMLRG
eukprot:scaffold5884_cov403-Prasinococcus_capsulatus_cf.AAC.5